jgi:glycosyltransferase involved in cell wall biosynthesis
MTSPKYSVVVPTRQRINTLEKCIESILINDFEDFELIVHDNASVDETQERVQAFDDSRLKYFRLDERVSMRRNFESSMEKARGQFVIYIGDDDGLTLETFPILEKLTQVGDCDFVSWPVSLQYLWPDARLNEDDQFVSLRRAKVFGAYSRISASAAAERMLAGLDIPFEAIPKIYHGCVSKRLIEKVRFNGEIFHFDIPDIGFHVAAAFSELNGMAIGHPLSVMGGSAKSTGRSTFANKDEKSDAQRKPFQAFIAEIKTDRSSAIPYNPAFSSIRYMTYVSMLIRLDGQEMANRVNHQLWIDGIVQELSRAPEFLEDARNADILSEIDERIVSALPSPNVSSNTGANSKSAFRRFRKRLRSRFDSRRIRPGTGFEDNIFTATIAISSAFGRWSRVYPKFPGWRFLQMYYWVVSRMQSALR